MSERMTGQCLCGAVKFRAETGTGIQACHCVQCQRWTGGGPYLCVSVTNLEVFGAEKIAAYHASEWGERAFCATCGSTLYWAVQGQEAEAVAAGLLDDQTGLSVTEEIFVDYRPAWLPPFEGAAQSTEAEQIAKFDAKMAEPET